MINAEEAAIVRVVFATFLEATSVTAVMQALNAKGFRTKSYTSQRGRVYAGHPWSKSTVRKLLMNPLYIGQIRYRGQCYPGQQNPIITDATWKKTQALLPQQTTAAARTPNTAKQVALLRGVIRCGTCDCAMTPSSCRKPNKSYRYYLCSTSHRLGQRTCPVRSIPAGEVEEVVIQELRALFRAPERLITQHRETHPEDVDGLRTLYNAVFALQHLDRTWESLSCRPAAHRPPAGRDRDGLSRPRGCPSPP